MHSWASVRSALLFLIAPTHTKDLNFCDKKVKNVTDLYLKIFEMEQCLSHIHFVIKNALVTLSIYATIQQSLTAPETLLNSIPNHKTYYKTLLFVTVTFYVYVCRSECVCLCVRTNLSLLPYHLLPIQPRVALSMGYWGKQHRQKLQKHRHCLLKAQRSFSALWRFTPGAPCFMPALH